MTFTWFGVKGVIQPPHSTRLLVLDETGMVFIAKCSVGAKVWIIEGGWLNVKVIAWQYLPGSKEYLEWGDKEWGDEPTPHQ